MHISIYAVAIRRTVRRIILDLSYSPDENYLGSGWVHTSVQLSSAYTLASVYKNYLSVLLPHPNPCFALGSRLDRLLNERSVVPALRSYYASYKPTPSVGIFFNITLQATLFRCRLLLHILFLLLGLGLVLVLGYDAIQRIRFRLGACTGPVNSEIAIIHRTVRRITSALYLCPLLTFLLSFSLFLCCGSFSGVGTGGSGSSMNRGPPNSWGPRVVGPQKNFRQDSQDNH